MSVDGAWDKTTMVIYNADYECIVNTTALLSGSIYWQQWKGKATGGNTQIRLLYIRT